MTAAMLLAAGVDPEATEDKDADTAAPAGRPLTAFDLADKQGYANIMALKRYSRRPAGGKSALQSSALAERGQFTPKQLQEMQDRLDRGWRLGFIWAEGEAPAPAPAPPPAPAPLPPPAHLVSPLALLDHLKLNELHVYKPGCGDGLIKEIRPRRLGSRLFDFPQLLDIVFQTTAEVSAARLPICV